MDHKEVPEAAKKISAEIGAALQCFRAITSSFKDCGQAYLKSEASENQEERVEGRRLFLFHLTMMRHLERQWKKMPMEMVNGLYDSMCEEFNAGHIEQEIIDEVKRQSNSGKSEA